MVLKVVGAVAVKVRPNTEGFAKDTKRDLEKQMRDLEKNQKEKLKIPAEVDVKQLDKNLRDSMREMNRKMIEDAKGQGNNYSVKFRARIDKSVRATALMAKDVAEAHRKFQSMADQMDVEFDATLNKSRAFDSINNMEIRPFVDMDGMNDWLDRFSEELNKSMRDEAEEASEEAAAAWSPTDSKWREVLRQWRNQRVGLGNAKEIQKDIESLTTWMDELNARFTKEQIEDTRRVAAEKRKAMQEEFLSLKRLAAEKFDLYKTNRSMTPYYAKFAKQDMMDLEAQAGAMIHKIRALDEATKHFNIQVHRHSQDVRGVADSIARLKQEMADNHDAFDLDISWRSRAFQKARHDIDLLTDSLRRFGKTDLGKKGAKGLGELGDAVMVFGYRSSGLRLLRETAEEMWEIVPRLDMSIPSITRKIALFGTALSAGASVVADAFVVMGDAMKVFNLGLLGPAGLATAGIAVLTFVSAMKKMGMYAPEFEKWMSDVGDYASAGFWSTAVKHFNNFQKALDPILKTRLPRVGAMLGDLTGGLMGGLTKDPTHTVAWMKGMEALFRNMVPGMRELGDALAHLIDIGSSFMPRFGTAFSGWMKDFNSWVDENAANGEIFRWIEEGVDAFKNLARVMWDTSGIMRSITGIFERAGGMRLEQFADMLERINAAMKSPALQEDIAKPIRGLIGFFDDVVVKNAPAIVGALKAIADIVTYSTDVLSAPVSGAFKGILEGVADPRFSEGIKGFVGGIGSFVKDITPGLKIMTREIGSFLDMVGVAAKAWGPAFNQLLVGFTDLGTDIHPGFRSFVESTGPMLTAMLDRAIPPARELARALSDLLGNKNFQRFIHEIIKGIGSWIGIFAKVTTWVTKLADALFDLYGLLPGWAKEAAGFAIAAGVLTGSLSSITSFAWLALAPLRLLWELLTRRLGNSWIIGLGARLMAGGAAGAGGGGLMGGLLGGLGSLLGGGLGGLVRGVKSFAGRIGPAIVGALRSVFGRGGFTGFLKTALKTGLKVTGVGTIIAIGLEIVDNISFKMAFDAGVWLRKKLGLEGLTRDILKQFGFDYDRWMSNLQPAVDAYLSKYSALDLVFDPFRFVGIVFDSSSLSEIIERSINDTLLGALAKTLIAGFTGYTPAAIDSMVKEWAKQFEKDLSIKFRGAVLGIWNQSPQWMRDAGSWLYNNTPLFSGVKKAINQREIDKQVNEVLSVYKSAASKLAGALRSIDIAKTIGSNLPTWVMPAQQKIQALVDREIEIKENRLEIHDEISEAGGIKKYMQKQIEEYKEKQRKVAETIKWEKESIVIEGNTTYRLKNGKFEAIDTASYVAEVVQSVRKTMASALEKIKAQLGSGITQAPGSGHGPLGGGAFSTGVPIRIAPPEVTADDPAPAIQKARMLMTSTLEAIRTALTGLDGGAISAPIKASVTNSIPTDGTPQGAAFGGSYVSGASGALAAAPGILAASLGAIRAALSMNASPTGTAVGMSYTGGLSVGLAPAVSRAGSTAGSIIRNLLRDARPQGAQTGSTYTSGLAAGLAPAAGVAAAKALSAVASMRKSGAGSGQFTGNSYVSGLASAAGKAAATGASNALKAIQAMRKPGTGSGQFTGSTFASGIASQAGAAASRGASLATRAIQMMRKSASPAGQYVGSTFASGISGMGGRAASAASGIANRSIGALRGISAFRSGAAIGATFAAGIESAIGRVRRAMSSMAAAARNFLPNSPSKEGPFSGSGWGGWGESIAEELARGIRIAAPSVIAEADAMMTSIESSLNRKGSAAFSPSFGAANSLPFGGGDTTNNDQSRQTILNVNVESRGDDPFAEGARLASDIDFALNGKGFY